MKNITFAIVIISIVLNSCGGGSKSSAPENKSFTLTEVWRSDTLLMTPESVIYDQKRDIFYVSNMNMEPRLKDGNGFISKIDKSGIITDLKWVEGLSSPKGLGIVADTLYVADLNELVAIDINQGTITKRIIVPGGMMLNDITTDDSGVLYTADTDANKIFKYSGGVVSEFITEGLTGPNGLLAEPGRLLVASQGANDFKSVKLPGLEQTLITDSLGHADGIVFTGHEGYYLISEWNGKIFVINPDNSVSTILNTVEAGINAADFWYNRDMNLILVPTFFHNNVIAYKLEEKAQE